MLKKHMAACLVASAFITMPVLAQTSTSPGATSPGAGQPMTSAGGSGAAASSSASGRFITQQQQNQWRASKLIGVNVYGADNERIGDINEVLVDRNGNADAVIVGVGGFLGIGEKNVALPFNAFEWMMEDTRRTAAASGTGARTDAPATTASRTTDPAATAPRSADPAASAGATAPAAPGTTATTSGAARDTAGTTASTSTAGTSARSSAAERGYPDHAVLRMSKADLQNAPTFHYVGDRSSDDRSGSGAARTSGAGTGTSAPATAPRQ